MKRVVEKIRDIVEVRPFAHLHDFAADPGLTLAGYHFTDITADLMAKWIDRVAAVKPGQGAALALAGFRGVGKSHFLAVTAAILSRPELRSQIQDPHIAASAERLSRRHNPVAFVRRGAGKSLLEEVKGALAETFSVRTGDLSDAINDLLLQASEKAGDSPLVLLFDTALGRDSRVARDDGVLLSEIAESAKTLGIFVGVALDDDISGADGPNSAISGCFSIDYLDQEHLYKIVDSHIFSKHDAMLPVLHDIYEYYREVLPGFRWSEPRFSSLYPLHPATLEIAPLVRLYLHDFALLGFASEAGVKILGRPANSLIGLDEVFDGVEGKLRTVAELKEAFAVFDKLDHDVVAKTPVQTRLQAKLILKGLLLLSLDGQGTSVADLAASMMIFDEGGAGIASLDVRGLLESFAAAVPESISKTDREGSESKYCLKLSGKDDLNSVLVEGIKTVSDDVIWPTLLRQTAEKFADVEISGESAVNRSSCSVEWRGAIRRGEIVWNAGDDSNTSIEKDELADWTVLVRQGDSTGAAHNSGRTNRSMIWKIAELTADEKDTIRRLHLLQTDVQLREEFKESIATTTHIHTISVEKIWQRVFFQDATLSVGGDERVFVEEARTVHNLTQLFTVMLASVFDEQYPDHPSFPQLLSNKQASNLIVNFFGRAALNSTETQNLAETFALPLGLAIRHGDAFSPTPAETLAELPFVHPVFAALKTDSNNVVPLADIALRMSATPFGLSRESQHLVLAALVAQRQLEFVTSHGNRINHRSLDLQIIWDDIIGVAKPADEGYSTERLLYWAKLLTGNKGIASLEKADDRSLVINLLSGWLTNWKGGQILERFDALPDENLNASIWRTAVSLRNSFGGVADLIDALIQNDLPLDECLQAIADLFSDSEAEFEKKVVDLQVLKDFTSGASKRDEITAYLSLCETTADAEIERLRRELLGFIAAGHFGAATSENEQPEQIWLTFKERYANYYAERHDAVTRSYASGQGLSEILDSDPWSAFDILSSVRGFDQRYAYKAKMLVRELRQANCDSNVRELLSTRSFCSCSFTLADHERLVGLPDALRALVSEGLRAFITRLMQNRDEFVAVLAGLSSGKESDASKTSILDALVSFNTGGDLPNFTSQEIRLVKLVAEQIFAADKASADEFEGVLPHDGGDWAREVEQLEVFANTEQ